LNHTLSPSGGSTTHPGYLYGAFFFFLSAVLENLEIFFFFLKKKKKKKKSREELLNPVLPLSIAPNLNPVR
jgi:hypothetical protein